MTDKERIVKRMSELWQRIIGKDKSDVDESDAEACAGRKN